MGMGLRSAELAATILQAAFRRELTWEQTAAEYDHRWRRAFLPRLRWGRCLEAMLLRPRLAGLACQVLTLAPWLMDAIYRCTRDIPPGSEDVLRGWASDRLSRPRDGFDRGDRGVDQQLNR